MGSGEIGVLIAVGSAFAIQGVRLGGRLTRKWLTRGLGYPLIGAGAAIGLVGPFLFLAAIAPNIVFATIAIFCVYFVGGVFSAPFLTVQSFVSPARVRTLSFSFGSLFLAGGFTAFILFFGTLADGSIRVGVAVLAPFWIIGGLVLASGHKTVDADTRRALNVLTTTAELREARLNAGASSLLLARGVDVAYGQTQVLFGVDFEVKEG